MGHGGVVVGVAGIVDDLAETDVSVVRGVAIVHGEGGVV